MRAKYFKAPDPISGISSGPCLPCTYFVLFLTCEIDLQWTHLFKTRLFPGFVWYIEIVHIEVCFIESLEFYGERGGGTKILVHDHLWLLKKFYIM